MSHRILIMGLPGAGKTTLAAALTALLMFDKKVTWLNADTVREQFNDWDFSPEGRLRQAHRMRSLADKEISIGRLVICDFVAPTPEIRNIFDADITIWIDTILQSRYEDTNKVFVPPEHIDFHITEQDAEKWAEHIAAHLLTTLYSSP